MSRSLEVLAEWATAQAHEAEDPDDRQLWRQIAREVDRYLTAQAADEHAEDPLWDFR